MKDFSHEGRCLVQYAFINHESNGYFTSINPATNQASLVVGALSISSTIWQIWGFVCAFVECNAVFQPFTTSIELCLIKNKTVIKHFNMQHAISLHNHTHDIPKIRLFLELNYYFFLIFVAVATYIFLYSMCRCLLLFNFFSINCCEILKCKEMELNAIGFH